jgi:hypothetical protein
VKSLGVGCGYCKGNRIDEADAVAVMREAKLEPLEPYPGKAVTPWRCWCITCDREVKPRYNDVQQGKRGCAYCAGIRVDPRDAYDTMVAAGLTPHGDYPGTHMPWACTCTVCGRFVTPTHASVGQGRGGCQSCGYVKTGRARRTDADVAAKRMREAGLEPFGEYPGATTRWECKCVACGNVVTPTYDAVVNAGGGGCIYCAEGGYDPDKPGLVYLLRHDPYEAFKVGIRNANSHRIRNHSRHGWSVVQEWAFENGSIPPVIEADVLAWWRNDLAAPIACAPEQMPQAGYTETARFHDVSEEATQALVHILVARLVQPAQIT